MAKEFHFALIDGQDVEFECDVKKEEIIEAVPCMINGDYGSRDESFGERRILQNIEPVGIELNESQITEAWKQIQNRIL